MQTLFHQLKKKWAYKIQKNEKNQITHLFFMTKTSQKILKKKSQNADHKLHLQNKQIQNIFFDN